MSPAVDERHSWRAYPEYSRKLGRSQYTISYILIVSFHKSSLDVVKVSGQGHHRWHHRYIQQQNPHHWVVLWPSQGTWLFESQRITKLSFYGDCGITSGWFKSTENKVSALSLQIQTITPFQTEALQSMGVPQASCLSLLHNNMPWTVTSESKPVLFADDTSIIIYLILMFAIRKCLTYMNIQCISQTQQLLVCFLLPRATCFDPYWAIFRPF